MSSETVGDERVAFYLRHQELIETWADIRKDVVQVAHAFFLSLAGELAARAPDLGAEVWVRDGNWSNIGLYRRDWGGADAPLISAAFEWNTKSTFVDGHRIVGLRAHHEVEDGRQLRPYIGDQVRELGTDNGFTRSSATWPAYRDAALPGSDAYWEELAGFGQQLVADIVDAWETFSQAADHAIAIWRSASS